MNVTVDDQFGDPTTGSSPKYSTPWVVGSPTENCPNCRFNSSNLDLTQIYRQTWHDTTHFPSETPATITVHFTGSAVYVFNLLPNTVPGAVTFANIYFSIDGEDVGTFTRSPDSSSTILYNQLVFHNTALHYGSHTLVMTPGSNLLTLFDYLVYTTQNDDSDNSPWAAPSITPTSTSTSDNEFQSLSSTIIPSISSSQPLSSSTSASAGSLDGASPSTSSTTPASTKSPDNPSQSPSPRIPAGAVVGAVFGIGMDTGLPVRFLDVPVPVPARVRVQALRVRVWSGAGLWAGNPWWGSTCESTSGHSESPVSVRSFRRRSLRLNHHV